MLRLSPKDSQNAVFYAAYGVAHYLEGRYDEAAAAAREASRQRPEFTGSHRVLCAALAQAGRQDEAVAALAVVRRQQPNVSVSLLRNTLPYSSPDAFERFAEGLRKAGLAKEQN